MKVTTVGLDIAKHVFQLHGADEHGNAILRRKLRRDEVAPFFANLPACTVGLEACGGAHYWARRLSSSGHTVRLIAPAGGPHDTVGAPSFAAFAKGGNEGQRLDSIWYNRFSGILEKLRFLSGGLRAAVAV